MNLRNLTIFALATLTLAGCMGKQEKKQTEDRQEQVKTEVLVKTDISRQVELSTTLAGYETMSISPSVTGKIEHIYVEVGDKVNKGDMLVRMDQMQYNTSKLTFSNLKLEMDRMTALKESEAISQQTYDQTKLSFDQTKENLDFLEKNTFVKAQYSGVISAKNYEDGELYSGQPILVLTQIATLKALINIPESFFPQVKTGMKVNVFSEIYPDKVFPAVIEIIYPTIDVASHTFSVKLKIPNAKEILRPGMYVRTVLPMNNVQTIVVPYQSVQKLVGSNERFVYLNDNGVAKRVFVKLGQRFDDKVEIISPEIKEGDELVTVGQAKLVDGVKLNVIK